VVGQRRVEIGQVVLVVGLIGRADHVRRARRQVVLVGRRGGGLEGLVGGGVPWAAFAGAGPQVALPAALVEVGRKPPWNQPQLTLCAFSRSPMFLPVIVSVPEPQSSRPASVSPITELF